MAIVDLSPTGTSADSSSYQVRSPRTGRPGLVPFKHIVTLATTHVDNADDGWLVFQFPATAYLHLDSFAVTCPDALDTNATPTLAFDVGTADSDGTQDIELINQSAVGQTANAVDYVDAAVTGARGGWLDVSGKYLSCDVTTAAATASAGILVFSGFYSDNLFPTSA